MKSTVLSFPLLEGTGLAHPKGEVKERDNVVGTRRQRRGEWREGDESTSMETASFIDIGQLFSGIVVNGEDQREGRFLVSHLGQGVSLDPSCPSMRRADIFC